MKKIFSIFMLVNIAVSVQAADISGPLVQWQTLTLSVNGPNTYEADQPSPFLQYRLNVTFQKGDDSYTVPGYYAGDGNGNGSGDVWQAKFTPPESGSWSYTVSFREGTNVAVQTSSNAGSAVNPPLGPNGESGNFEVADHDSTAKGFLSKGRLLADPQSYYFKFANGEYWIKTGADSPENFLAFNGFDGSRDSVAEGLDIGFPNYKFHTYAAHEDDWNNGDPNWTDEDDDEGKGIIGALNYLSEKGVNSIFALLMNIGGDAKDVYPFIAEPGTLLSRGDDAGDENSKQTNNNYWYDISKLHQWEIVFAHAQRKGIALHLVFNEGERQNKEELDNALLGNERKLYYREMIARFAHHNAVMWNISEEYNHHDLELQNDEVATWAAEVRRLDTYNHPVTIHPIGTKVDLTVWKDLAGDEERTYAVYDDDPEISQHFDHASWQIGSKVHTHYLNNTKSDRSFKVLPAGGLGDFVERWRKATENTGKKVVHIDEAMPSSTHDDELMRFFCRQDADGNWLPIKEEVLRPFYCQNPETVRFMMSVGQAFVRKNGTYPVLFSGGGTEYILETLFSTDNFRDYEAIWDYSRYAREFLESLPFAEMEPHDELLRHEAGTGEVLAKIGEAYAVYLPAVREIQSLYLAGNTEFSQTWMNPRTGNEISATNVQTTGEGELVTIVPPSGVTLGDDWAIKFEAVGSIVANPNVYVPKPTVFLEKDGIVVMEAESGDPLESGSDASTGYWALENVALGGGMHTGEGYYNWLIDKQIKCAPAAETAGKLIYKFKISEDYTGDYYLQLRSWHGFPASKGDQENDVWTKIDDGGWHKTSSTGALSNLDKWTWKTSRRFFSVSDSATDCPENGDIGEKTDKYKNRVLVKNLSAGEHTLELTGRSANFRIDRIHLFHESIAQTVGEDALLPESKREDLTDEDNDGLPDWWEEDHFGNLNQGPSGDFDNDGHTNLEEYRGGSDPKDPNDPGESDDDTDNDNLPDSWEIDHFGNLDQDANDDFDNDGYTNLAEYNLGSDPKDPTDPGADPIEITVNVAAGNDDAKQTISTGRVKLVTDDLDMPLNGDALQVVGVRFDRVDIPQGATITSASIQFTAKESGSSSNVSLKVYGENADNPPAFTSADNDISDREKTSASYNWNNIPAWVVDRASSAEETGDLSEIVQEIVNRNGWQEDNAMVFIIEDNGSTTGARRKARSYDGNPQDAPLLTVRYTQAVNQEPIVDAGADQNVSLQNSSASIHLNGTASDDGLPASLTTTWSSSNGPAAVTFADTSTLSTTATFTQPGNYTLTLEANDGELSASDSLEVQVIEVGRYLQDDGAQGLLAFETENSHANVTQGSHAWSVITTPANASGGGAMVTLPNSGLRIDNNIASTSPGLQYNVKFVKTGLHYVWLRGNADGSGGDDSVHVGLDNVVDANIQALTLNKASDWTWSNSKQGGGRIIIDVQTVGNHIINIWMREDGASIDKMVFTTDVDFVPTGVGPQESQYVYIQENNAQGLLAFEAEGHHDNLAPGSHSWNIVTTPAGASGGEGMVSLPNDGIRIDNDVVTTSPGLEYHVEFAHTGIHYVWIRGNANGSGGDDSLYVGLDGVIDPDTQKLTLNRTADWIWSNNRQGGGRVTIDVQTSGAHVFNIWMREDGTSLDNIIITTDPDFVPDGI